MPPGASPNRENQFALLANESPPKKKKIGTSTHLNLFPDLPATNTANPKYVVLSSAENDKTISDFSTFAVHKAIQNITKEINSITELRDGNLLLLVKNNKIAEKFLNANQLPGICRIKCKLHESLNVTKGTIYAPYLNKIPEDEIISELKSQGVIGIYKFTKHYDGKQIPSGLHLLSFDSYHLPGKIDISWHSVKVREYIPNPMRCKSCQLLGHTMKWCKNSPACANCNLPPHSPNECSRCANCQENHPASSQECKKFIQQKQILSIKIKNKCTINKAKQIYNSLFPVDAISPPNSYAYVAASSQRNQSYNNSNALNKSTNEKNNDSKNNTTTKDFQQKKSLITDTIETTSNSLTNISVKNNTNKTKTNSNETTTNIHSHKISKNKLPAPSNQTISKNNYDSCDRNVNKNQHTTEFEMASCSNAQNSNSIDSLTSFSNSSFQTYMNNPNFIPPLSLNSVLSKSQISLNNLSDSDN